MNKLKFQYIAMGFLVLSGIYLGGHGLLEPKIEGLDGAHHLLDGVFFRDFFVDLPLTEISSYPFDYYAQYPALGFIFWPPLFPFMEGLFFLVGGVKIISAQVLVLVYSCAGMLLGFHLLRRRLGSLFAVMAILLLFSLPEFIKYQNVVMLELPSVVMGLWTFFIYQNIVGVERGKVPWQRYALFSIVGAGCLYTKQTMFFIFPAIGVDILFNHRQLLKDRGLWGSIFFMAVFILPLVIFTLKFGSANIAQSFGHGTSIVMPQYNAVDRWSWEAWGFYLRVIRDQLPVIVLIGSVLSVAFFVSDRRFAKENTIWFACIICFYLFFSFFDNRSERFAVLVYPPIIFLFFSALKEGYDRVYIQNKGRKLLEVVPWAGLCVVIVFAGLNGWKHKISGFSGVDTIISDLNVSHMDGNLAYSGKYRQLFVYYFRQYDVNRDHSFLQADDILEKGVDWGEQLSKYRVRYILVENDRVEMIEALGKVEYVNKVAEKVFNSPKVAREIVTYEFVGEFAKDMSKPPLKSTLLF